MMSKKIAVLGAGPMGLAVAYQLIQEGYKPVVFEADDRVGGMTASFDFGGLAIERYYHFHCTSDHAFFKILKELSIENKLHWTATKMGYFYKNKLLPWGNPLSLLTFPGLSFVAKLRYGLHAFHSTKRKNWQSLDKLEASAWIRKWIGKEAYEVLWSKLFDFKFYEYANQLSAAWIWSRIRRIGRSRYNIFKEKLGYLEGGSETLLHAMRSYIEAHGGEIHLNSAVREVVTEGDALMGIRVGESLIPCDKVISTIPIPYLAKLIPGLPENILSSYRGVKNIAVVCVIAKLKRRVSENFWLNINDPSMDIPGLVEYSNLRPLDQNIVYVPFYMPGEHPKFQDSDEIYLTKVQNYLQKINPELKSSDFLEMRASRYRYAQPICSPEHLSRLPSVQLPIKHLWAADTSYYYPEDRGISESIEFGRNLAKQAVAS